ncbi:MAG: EsaB/YukD family protein [Candidatus Glassbacteria bacterium]
MGSSTVCIKVKDASGQVQRRASVPREANVSELVEQLVPQLNLPSNDLDGRPVSYHLRNERTGQELSGTQTVSDAALREDDTLRLMPEITPGRGR